MVKSQSQETIGASYLQITEHQGILKIVSAPLKSATPPVLFWSSMIQQPPSTFDEVAGLGDSRGETGRYIGADLYGR